MSNAFKTVAKTMGKIVGGEHLPLRRTNVYRFVLGNSVGGQIPHLGVAILDILLHSQKGSHGLVFAIMHVGEFLEISLDILLGVLATESGTLFAILSSSLEFDFGFLAMTDISLALLDQFSSKIV